MRCILVVFLVFSLNSFSQEYKPLLDDLNEWKLTSCFFGCLTDTYYTDGDTLVDGKTHKILDGYHYISRTFLLREEVAERKVYLTKINASTIDEFLIYDFSLQEGDSIEMSNPYSPFPENGGYFILDSIKIDVLEDGEDYNHFYFSPAASNTISSNNAEWIEGLGSLSLINAPGGDSDINGAGSVSCYFKNEKKVYENLDSISECVPSIFLDAPAYDPLQKVVLLSSFNNKTAELLNTENVSEIHVFNISGEKVGELRNDFQKTVSINFEEKASGLYFIKVKSNFGESKTFKYLLK